MLVDYLTVRREMVERAKFNNFENPSPYNSLIKDGDFGVMEAESDGLDDAEEIGNHMARNSRCSPSPPFRGLRLCFILILTYASGNYNTDSKVFHSNYR